MVTMEHKQSKSTVLQGSRNTFEPWQFQNDQSYGIKNYCIEVPLNGFTSVPDFMKIYQAIQKLLVQDTQVDRLVVW
jgi:hypothetical protein